AIPYNAAANGMALGLEFNSSAIFEAKIMVKVKPFGSTTAAAFIFAACGGNAVANNAVADTPERMASGPTKAELITLEESAYEAWKSKDAKFWGTFLSDKFVGWFVWQAR